MWTQQTQSNLFVEWELPRLSENQTQATGKLSHHYTIQGTWSLILSWCHRSERKVQKTECVSYQTLSKLFCVFQNSIGHEFTETNWNAPLEFVGNNSSWKRTGKVLLANFRKISSRVTDIKGKFSNFSSCVQGLLKSWGFHVMGKKKTTTSKQKLQGSSILQDIKSRLTQFHKFTNNVNLSVKFTRRI